MMRLDYSALSAIANEYGCLFSLGFSLRSRITIVPKPPVSIINHNSQLSSKFTSSTWTYQVIAQRSCSHFRCYHVDCLHAKVRQFNRPTKLISVLTALGIGGILYYWNVSTYTDQDHFLLLTVNQEKQIGWSQFQEKRAQFQGRVVPTTDSESVRVKLVLSDILIAMYRSLHREMPFSHLEGLNWEVLVVKDDAVYASCLPGGKIIVFTGMLERFSTDEELATIIANEVAHVMKRHSAESYTMRLWLAPVHLIMHKLGMPLHVETSPTYLQEILFAHKNVISSWDRVLLIRMAIQAYYIGLVLMAADGYDPRVAPKVFEKMDPVSDGNPAFEHYISTHPWGVARSKVLSDANAMQKAISLYEGAIARRREVDT